MQRAARLTTRMTRDSKSNKILFIINNRVFFHCSEEQDLRLVPLLFLSVEMRGKDRLYGSIDPFRNV